MTEPVDIIVCFTRAGTHTILRSETGEKLAHLVRARKTRFVHEVEVLVLRVRRGFPGGTSREGGIVQ